MAHCQNDYTLIQTSPLTKPRFEAVHEQTQSLKGVVETQAGILDELCYKQKHSKKPKGDKGRGKHKTSSQAVYSLYHTRDKCPAKDATCHKCQRKGGHYSSQFFTKTIATLEFSGESHHSLVQSSGFLKLNGSGGCSLI